MRGRSPARLLAPLALVVTAVALFSVVTSGSTSDDGGGGSKAVTTATPKATSKQASKRKSAPKTYTVKPGDTPSGIAQRLNVAVGELLDANPRADPNNLHPGQKLTIP